MTRMIHLHEWATQPGGFFSGPTTERPGTMLRKPTRRDFYQALERAARAFAVAAVALYPVQSIINNLDGTAPIDASLARKAVVAGSVAAVSFLWRYFLPDVGRSLPPSPAADNPPNIAVAAAEAAGEPAPDEAA